MLRSDRLARVDWSSLRCLDVPAPSKSHSAALTPSRRSTGSLFEKAFQSSTKYRMITLSAITAHARMLAIA
jgi:hypothetical protein